MAQIKLNATYGLTGNLPALNASALTNLDARDLENALPAISGASLTGVEGGMVKLYQNDWSSTPVDSIASGAVFTSDYHFYKVYLYSACETTSVTGKVWLTDGGVDVAGATDYWTVAGGPYIDKDQNNTSMAHYGCANAQSFGQFWNQTTYGTTKDYPNALELTIFDPLGGVVDNSGVVHMRIDSGATGLGNKVFREIGHIECKTDADADGIRFALTSDGYIYGQIEIYGMKRS